MSLKRRQVKEAVDYPKRPRLTRSIAELIDEADRKDEDLYQGTIEMRRSLPKEQADTPQLMDPTLSRRIFDRDALRAQLLKAKAKRIGTTSASATRGPTPVKGERFEPQRDYKEFIIEMEEANRAFLEYMQAVRNEVPIDTLKNLQVSNYPKLFALVFFDKHPWRDQLREFYGWFYSFPRDKTIRYDVEWEKLYEQLRDLSDFNIDYMEQTTQAIYMISALFRDHVEALNEGGQPDDMADLDDMPPLDDGSPLDTKETEEFDPVDYRIDPDDPREYELDIDGTISEIAMDAFNSEAILSDSQTDAVLTRPRGIPVQEVIDALVMVTTILRLEIDRIPGEGIIVSERAVASGKSVIRFLFQVSDWVNQNQKPSERARDRDRTQAEESLAEVFTRWLSIVAPNDVPDIPAVTPAAAAVAEEEEEEEEEEEVPEAEAKDVYGDMQAMINSGTRVTNADKKRWDRILLDVNNQPYDEQGLVDLVNNLNDWVIEVGGMTANKAQVDAFREVVSYLEELDPDNFSPASQQQIASLTEIFGGFEPKRVVKGYVKTQVNLSPGRPLHDLFTIYFNRGRKITGNHYEGDIISTIKHEHQSDAWEKGDDVRRTLRLLMDVVRSFDGKSMRPGQLEVVDQFADIMWGLLNENRQDIPQDILDLAADFEQLYANEATIIIDPRAPLRRIEL